MRHRAGSLTTEPLAVPRVILFTPGVFERGGAATHTRKIARGLTERGWDVTLICRAFRHSLAPETRLEGFRVLHPPSIGVRALDVPVYLLVGIARALPIARGAVFVGLQLLSPFTGAAIASRVTRRPLFGFSFASGDISEIGVGMESRTWRLRRRLLRSANALVAQTTAGASEIERAVLGARVRVVPTPAGAGDARPLNGAPRVLTVGRLTSEKGLGDLLAAWPAVLEATAGRAELRIAGVGEGVRDVEPELRATVAAGLADSVELLGWIDEVTPLLGDSDVYAHPSTSEGMSNSLLEACVAGRVVVASDIPGNVEVLGEDYPLLHRPGDADDLAEMLVLAVGDPAVREAALARVEERIERFRLDRVVDEIDEMLRSALG